MLELGGKAPCIILADADLDRAVSAAAFGSFANSGQGCLSTERIIVDQSIAAEFCGRLAAVAKTVVYGDPRNSATVLGPVINAAAVKRLTELVEDAVASGARLLSGGTAEGPCFAPTVLSGVTPAMRVYREESFGPLASVVTVDGPEEALRVANDNDYGLSSAIFSRDVTLALDLAKRLNAGMSHINGTTLDDEAQTPFGGVKDSGYGRSGGAIGIEELPSSSGSRSKVRRRLATRSPNEFSRSHSDSQPLNRWDWGSRAAPCGAAPARIRGTPVLQDREATMHWFSIGVALLAAIGIIVIGVTYLSNPRAATQSFGLPLPEEGANIPWWLRLKGVRDVVSGLVLLAVMVWGGPRMLGIALLIEALTPAGDMSLVVAAKGPTKAALGMHGLTAPSDEDRPSTGRTRDQSARDRPRRRP